MLILFLSVQLPSIFNELCIVRNHHLIFTCLKCFLKQISSNQQCHLSDFAYFYALLVIVRTLYILWLLSTLLGLFWFRPDVIFVRLRILDFFCYSSILVIKTSSSNAQNVPFSKVVPSLHTLKSYQLGWHLIIQTFNILVQ